MRDVADRRLGDDADAGLIRSGERASLSSSRQRPASSARQVAPACFIVSIVCSPTTGTSKRMSWFGLATFTTVSARLSVEGSLPSEATA